MLKNLNNSSQRSSESELKKGAGPPACQHPWLTAGLWARVRGAQAAGRCKQTRRGRREEGSSSHRAVGHRVKNQEDQAMAGTIT